MSQMNTLQVNTVYTERNCTYVRVRCNCLKRNTLTLIYMLLFWGMKNLHVEQTGKNKLFDCSWNKRQLNVVRCEVHKCITHVNCVGTAPFSNILSNFCIVWVGQSHTIAAFRCNEQQSHSVKSLVNLSDARIFWDSWTLWIEIITPIS